MPSSNISPAPPRAPTPRASPDSVVALVAPGRGRGDRPIPSSWASDNVLPHAQLPAIDHRLGRAKSWSKYIKSFNHLTRDGGQFSTSQGRGVRHGSGVVDPARRLLALVVAEPRAESGDSEPPGTISSNRQNKDLADVLGNFVSRITKFCRKVRRGESPRAANTALMTRPRRWTMASAPVKASWTTWEVRNRRRTARIGRFWATNTCNPAAPWSTFKTDLEKAAMQVRLA